MRDVVRVERGGLAWADYLSEPELMAVEAILDRHLSAFAELRATELDAFLRELPAGEPAEIDRTQSALIARHRHLLVRIAALDEETCDGFAAALGPARSEFVARLRAARRLERTNAIVVADGGGVLLDLRWEVDRLRLDDEARSAVEPALRMHEEAVGPLIDRILDAQTSLPLAHRDVLARSGPPERDVPGDLEGRPREEAIHRATFARILAARRDLDAALLAYQARIDASIARIGESSPETAARLRLVVLRRKTPDNPTPQAERLAYELLIASRALEAPPELRGRLAGLRDDLVASEARCLAALDDFAARRRAERDAGREAEAFERASVVARDRGAAIERARTSYEQTTPSTLRAAIAALAQSESDAFPDALARIVGAERVRALLVERPVGFGDRTPRPAERRREGGAGDFNRFLPPAPEIGDLDRLARRAGLDEGGRVVAAALLATHRERWEAERAESAATFERLVSALGGFGGDPEPVAFDRALRALVAAMAERRALRAALDRSLEEDLAAALPAGAEPALALWRIERVEQAIHLDWSSLPADDRFRMPPLARVRLLETIADAGLDPSHARALAEVVRGHETRFVDAGARLRDAALEATRSLLVVEVEARAAGLEPDASPEEANPALRRLLAPVRDAAQRFADMQYELLDACAARLPPSERRRLREAVAAAALPRLVEASIAEGGLIALVADPSLDAGRRAEIDGLREAASARRDAALDPLLARARMAIDPDPTGLRDGVVIAARFTRRDADARALRRAWALLDDGERARHAGLLAALDEQPRRVRAYD